MIDQELYDHEATSEVSKYESQPDKLYNDKVEADEK